MKQIIFVIFFIALFNQVAVALSDSASSKATVSHSIIFYGGAAAYNKSYEDIRYKDRAKLTFPTLLINTGAEYIYKFGRRHVAGCGVVQSTIYDKSFYVQSPHEESTPSYRAHQALTAITMPYFFGGKEFKWAGIHLGIGCYFYMEKFDGEVYLNHDGAGNSSESKIDLNQRESHVFPNAQIRIFPEDFIHMKIRFGRGRMNLVDNIFNAAVIFPFGSHRVETSISLPPPTNWFKNEAGSLRTNQRVDFSYSFGTDCFRIGVEAGVLISNRREGGSVDFINRLNGNLFIEVTF